MKSLKRDSKFKKHWAQWVKMAVSFLYSVVSWHVDWCCQILHLKLYFYFNVRSFKYDDKDKICFL